MLINFSIILIISFHNFVYYAHRCQARTQGGSRGFDGTPFCSLKLILSLNIKYSLCIMLFIHAQLSLSAI